MSVIATTATVRLPLDHRRRARQPTRLQTLAVRLALALQAVCPRAIILIHLPPVRFIASQPPPLLRRGPQAPIRPVARRPLALTPASRPTGLAARELRAISRRGTPAVCRRRHWAAIPAVRKSFQRVIYRPRTPATNRQAKPHRRAQPRAKVLRGVCSFLDCSACWMLRQYATITNHPPECWNVGQAFQPDFVRHCQALSGTVRLESQPYLIWREAV